MERKDSTKKEELLASFEYDWKQATRWMSKEERESWPFCYLEEQKKIINSIFPEYRKEIEKAFASLPPMESVGAEQREKMFMDVVRESLSYIDTFVKKIADIDHKYLDFPEIPKRFTDNWERILMRGFILTAEKYDMDPARFLVSGEYYYTVALQAGLLDQAGAIDKYKETGRADVLLWGAEKNLARLKEDEGLKWLSEGNDDNDLKALYLYAAMAHGYRTGKIQEAMYPEFYLISKMEEASRHDCEYIDKTHDYDDSMFCDRVATMMDYFQEYFTPVFPNLRNMAKSAEPYGMTPILGSVLKAAKERDEKLLQDSVFVKTHPTLAAIIHRRLALSFDNGVPFSAVDGKSEEMTLRKYGERIMLTANAFLARYYRQNEMSDEKKAEVEDQLKGFEELGSRFDHRFFDLKPEPYGYASWPKEYQFIRSSSNQTNQKTPANTEPSKTIGQKTSDSAEPVRSTNHPHRKSPSPHER